MKLTSMILFLLGNLLCSASIAQDVEPYALQPGDVISISVLEDSLLDRQTLVAPDGRISMPLVGSIIASGLTPQQLEAALRKRLRSKFVEPPNVTVSLVSLSQKEEDEEKNPREIYVLGEVNSPGRYTYDPETEITALQALTLAGGLSTFAAEDRIQIRQREGNTETLRLFNYEALENGVISTTTDLDALQDGAIIIVPERGLFD